MRSAYSIVKMMMETNSTRIRMRKSQSGMLNVQRKTETMLKTISAMITSSKIRLAMRLPADVAAEGWIGALKGPLTAASGGIGAALTAGLLVSLLFDSRAKG